MDELGSVCVAHHRFVKFYSEVNPIQNLNWKRLYKETIRSIKSQTRIHVQYNLRKLKMARKRAYAQNIKLKTPLIVQNLRDQATGCKISYCCYCCDQFQCVT